MVAALKNETPAVYKTLKFDADGAEMWSNAVDRVRMSHGGYEGGEDISESTAAVFLAAEFLALPSEFDLVDDEVDPGFHDVFEAA
jgi:hypothetical protein